MVFLGVRHAHEALYSSAAFIVNTMKSVSSDVVNDRPGAKEISDVINSDFPFALDCARRWVCMPGKPLNRCENCTKTREDIGGNPKFML
jgi:hypothetical protein